MSSELSLAQTVIGSLQFSFKKRVPSILQKESSECGLACLCMVSNYHGNEISLEKLRRTFNLSNKGVSLRGLIDVASSLELNGRAVKLDINSIKELSLPCVLHWGMNHFVVLKFIKGNRFHINDPAVGAMILSLGEFSEKFTGVALELTPSNSFKKEKSIRSVKISNLWSKIIGLKKSLLLILSLSLLIQLFNLASPLFLQFVVDDVLSRSDFGLLNVLAFGFSLLVIISVITETVRSWIVLHLSSKLNAQMGSNLFRHLVRLPREYFSARHVGDVVSRFSSLDRVRQLLSSGLISTIVDGLMASITLIAMFYYSSTLAFIVIAYVGAFALMRYVTYMPIQSLIEAEIMASAEANSHFMETVRAIETVKLFQLESLRVSEWQNRFFRGINKHIRIEQLSVLVDSGNKLLLGIGAILVVYYAAHLTENNSFSVGMLFAFLAYADRFGRSATSFMTQLLEFRVLNVHLDRLSDIVEAEPDRNLFLKVVDDSETDEENPLKLEKRPPTIELINAGFRYADNQPFAFRNVNFRINSAESAVLVGPSGCGKTTLLKCIAGLMRLTEGELLVDGRPIEDIEDYRSSIGTVMQDDDLLAGDLYENISGFAPVINTDRVIMCAHFANIDKEIFEMPMGFHTLIGDMGGGLSGGQKQRIILARAFYRQPAILLLDEATNQLDINNEQLVSSNIKNTWAVTRILVAHRPETIQSADRIIDMRK